MNTLTSQKDTGINRSKGMKKTALVMAIVAGALFSVNASATQTSSVEAAVSDFVVTQGKQIMNELNVQLQKTIDSEIQTLANSLLKHTSISSLPSNEMVNTDKQQEKAKLLAKAANIEK